MSAARATVKTTQYVDPRIEPPPDPVYDHVIGPVQNQYYQIPASALSDSYIAFNNLTTLGVDRAYLDTFELELTVQITFHSNKDADAPDAILVAPIPDFEEWTFDSFPFNKCCEEARVNINGGAFFSQPLSYIRAKERYMNQKALGDCYENVCPIHKPILQTESGKKYNRGYTYLESMTLNKPVGVATRTSSGVVTAVDVASTWACPTRLGAGMFNAMQSAQGVDAGYNNSIIRTGGAATDLGYNNYHMTGTHNEDLVVITTWREPVCVSPFSSRYDATYGRPLYNITSLDLAFNMQNLGNMIRVTNLNNASSNVPYHLLNYDVHIVSARLCYQVMTIPATLNKPLTTLVPYRRFVPYITDYPNNVDTTKMNPNGGPIQITSGVYTLNEIPTAIWVFCAPSKSVYQTNEPDIYRESDQGDDNNTNQYPNYDSNKLFAYLQHLSISMANTTQILNTAQQLDLYRIAKANGCQDSYWSWGVHDAIIPKQISGSSFYETANIPPTMYNGAGSVLRLIPGVDIILPDQPLIPGANANNMVLQVTADFIVPPHSTAQNKYALWLLFEYVGVAAISPGQCEITMNPLGSGEIMSVSPILSATSAATEGKLEGSGFWDKLKDAAQTAHQLQVISRLLKVIPNAKVREIANGIESVGFGERGCKRMRGGAVMGLGDWT